MKRGDEKKVTSTPVGGLIVIGGNDCANYTPGLAGVGGSDDARRSRLSRHRRFPEGRNLWSCLADQARRCICSIEHCRRRGEKLFSRVGAVSRYYVWIPCR